jgi:hypothetical protein
LILSAEVVATVLEQEAVLLDLRTKYFYSVNSSGWAITQLFESGATRDAVHTQCRAWGAPADAHEQIERFIGVFTADDLVANGPAAPAASVSFAGPWMAPTIEKHKEPLQRIMVSAFDPSIPLAE